MFARTTSVFFSVVLFALVILSAGCRGAAPAAPLTVQAEQVTATTSSSPVLPKTATVVPPTPTPPQPPTASPSPWPAVSPAIAPTTNSITPAPLPTASAIATTALGDPGASMLRVSESSVTFDAYPYARFMQPARDAALNFPFLKLDRGAYGRAASAEGTTPAVFRSVVLENEYLRLVFIPELGGRLFQITYKPTGQTLLYNNRVLKPTGWGPAQQSGWLAAGGIEWALPVNEHGYEWGIPWQYTVTQNASAATITLADSTASDRVRARVTVSLPAHAAWIMIQPRVENPTTSPAPVQFWLNAQIHPGSSTRISPDLNLILPTDSVWVHSSGDRFIPQQNIPSDEASAPSAPVAWPVVGGVDLSHYSNWPDYLGVFAAGMEQPFAAVFDPGLRLGLARVFPMEAAPGVKLFAFGHDFCCRGSFADDGSDYIELWGGLPRTFFPSDDVTLGPGQAREWTEYWVPVGGTPGLSAATRDGALYLSAAGGTVQIGAYATRRMDAVVVLLENGSEIARWSAVLAPGSPFNKTAAAGAGRLQLRLLDSAGNVLCEIK